MTCRSSGLMQLALLCFCSLLDIRANSQRVTPTKVNQASVILGVLEDLPGKNSGESDIRAVRTVFEKIGERWQAFPTQTESYGDLQTLPASYPKEMAWTLVIGGMKLGSISSQARAHFSYYSDIGIEYLTSHDAVPTVGRKSADYSGFLSVPVYRPLVAVSQPNYSDPEHWKVARASAKLITAARKEFRIRFPHASNCKNPEEIHPRTWKYRDEDIRVNKTYSSKEGWSLIELHLTGYACDGPPEDEFEGQWYVVGAQGRPRFLGGNMWLVDAGDYDGDGKSEVLFSIDEYNAGGYRLFYRKFTRSVEFLYHYH
jgi:hypothetical protein